MSWRRTGRDGCDGAGTAARIDPLDLRHQPQLTRVHLPGFGSLVNTALAAAGIGAPAERLDRVRDLCDVCRDPGIIQRPVEYPAGRIQLVGHTVGTALRLLLRRR
jgi:hypothetical protein